MTRIRLTLAYDGTDFSGWQLQPHDRTVQGDLEKALGRILGHSPRVHGSGRTDSGVHAMGQVCHFDCPPERADIPWQRALNSMLPTDIRVLESARVPEMFHARYSATGKIYEYVLWHTREFCLPQRRRFVWACGSVDYSLMLAGADALLGEHDFAAFQNVGTPVKSTVRTVSDISFRTGLSEHETVWRFEANGFLKQMVRNIVGCLVACGRGRITPQEVRGLLKGRNRMAAPATAPPQGLSLASVLYSSEK
ncbi:tRNA pseudouridine(38-40) synthase TruA [Pseudodesulfovibrio piezophilus]|uniref:tRNA pseudouridine synthase A n=1 Tax=Pseudodesulfovibrio piezophilus (strain DSM 21447 / JCM 15486 / C1TLV30) TaxID=1322246 RepID=M1WSN2_PSEP2|nr:tRNA pseudouridine(38-40) synthase TruA [Pseudodesulfovibrio piezophilus]CCH48987.1 tRNA pseudouridine synthase A [Pseudodesulfovibrio piezophilus C1TLV30]